MNEFDKTHAMLAVAVAALMLTVAVGMPLTAEDPPEPEPVSEPTEILLAAGLVLVGIGAGVIISEVVSYLRDNGNEENPAGDTESIKEFARQMSMGNAVDSISILSNTVFTLIDNNNKTWTLSQSYLNRLTEIAAATQWDTGRTYNPAEVLRYASVYDLIGDGLYNVSYAIGYGLNSLGDRESYWNGQTDWGSSIESGLEWDGGSLTATSSLRIEATSIVDADQISNRVYLSADDKQVTVWSKNGGTIYDEDGVQVATVAAGEGTVDLPDGFYRLSQGRWAGPFLPYVSAGEPEVCADVSGGAVIIADGSMGYVTVSGEDLVIDWAGMEASSDYLRYRFSADGTVKTTEAAEGYVDPVAEVIRSYADQMDVFQDCIEKAAVAGQVMWNISSTAGAANILLSPSSISPDLVDLGMDANQSYALYVSALSQIADYYDSYGEVLEAGDVRISADSLRMYCYGTIRDQDGTVIMEDVVFTPYVYIRNMTIESGTTNTFSQDGIVMVWSGDCTGLDDFNASSASSYGAVVMPKGASITVEEIIYDGEHTNSVQLTVKEIGRTEGLAPIVPEPMVTPNILDASVLVMIIIVELAAIVALLGYSFRVPVLFIVALVIVLIALLATDWITEILLEMFG